MKSFARRLSEITDYLFLSGIGGITLENFNECKITHVVNIAKELYDQEYPTEVSKLFIPIVDMPAANLDRHLEECVDYIHNAKNQGGHVLVHCVAGISRSASVCIAYLMKYHNLTLRKAYHRVFLAREFIYPNHGFWKCLVNYEIALRGETTVEMLPYVIGECPDVYKQDVERRIKFGYMDRLFVFWGVNITLLAFDLFCVYLASQDNTSTYKMNLEMFTQIAQINDHLYLSSAAAVKPERIRQLGITSIINATLEIPNLNLPNLECIQIHIEDSPTARLSVYFDRCSDKINQVQSRGGKTLVHCIAGVSRSASLCMAYLMKYQRMTLEQAYHFVKRKRPVIHPNFGFWRQLIDYERRIYGRNTVKMVQSNVGPMPDVYFEESRSVSYVPSRNHSSSLSSNLGSNLGSSSLGSSMSSSLGSSLSTRLSRTSPSWYNGFSSY